MNQDEIMRAQVRAQESACAAAQAWERRNEIDAQCAALSYSMQWNALAIAERVRRREEYSLASANEEATAAYAALASLAEVAK